MRMALTKDAAEQLIEACRREIKNGDQPEFFRGLKLELMNTAYPAEVRLEIG